MLIIQKTNDGIDNRTQNLTLMAIEIHCNSNGMFNNASIILFLLITGSRPNPKSDEIAAIFYAIKDFRVLNILGKHYQDLLGVVINEGILFDAITLP